MSILGRRREICEVDPWKRRVIGDHGLAVLVTDGDGKRRLIAKETETLPTGQPMRLV